MLYDISSTIILVTFVLLISLFILISFITLIQIHQFTKKGLFLLVKEKDLSVSKPSLIKIRFHHLALTYSLRDLFSSPQKLIRIFVATCFLVASLLITYTSYQSVSHIYNEDALGITFDYLINPIEPDVLESISDLYIEDIAAINVYENTSYMERLDDFNYVSIYKYYNINTIYFYTDIEPFMSTLLDGEAAEATTVCYESNCDYSPSQSNISNRIAIAMDALIGEDAESSTYSQYQQLILKISYKAYSSYYGNNTLDIKASQDSLINDGYVAFVPSNETKQFNDELPTNIYRSLVNVKEGTESEFEAFLNEEGITYISYEDYLLYLNDSNAKVNDELFAVLIYVLIMLFLLLSIVVIANTLEDESYKKYQYDKMRSIGYTNHFINKVRIIKPILCYGFSLFIAIAFYLSLQNVYFSYLKDLLGLSSLHIYGYESLYISLILGVLLLLFASFYDNIKSE